MILAKKYVSYFKAALRSYARTWAAEFKDRGIRVNTLSPGVTDTSILGSQVTSPKERELLVNIYLNMIPFGRLARAARPGTRQYVGPTDFPGPGQVWLSEVRKSSPGEQDLVSLSTPILYDWGERTKIIFLAGGSR